ncbi:MAG: hypothetical protein U0231_00715 [Nitrospiraceae bacterium]
MRFLVPGVPPADIQSVPLSITYCSPPVLLIARSALPVAPDASR